MRGLRVNDVAEFAGVSTSLLYYHVTARDGLLRAALFYVNDRAIASRMRADVPGATERDTLQPATRETAAICDRLLELGAVMQPTSDHLNVLKVKPPLCIDRESADIFFATLDRALDELGH